MDIQIDSREHSRAIKKIIQEFDKQHVVYDISKLITGDYMSFDNPRLIIDRKRNLSEVYSNLCPNAKSNPKDKNKLLRIDREMIRANRLGIKILFLIEHGNGIDKIEDVAFWENPQLEKSPYAWNGETLYKRMVMFSKRHNVKFEFCDKNNTGKRIIELLRTSS